MTEQWTHRTLAVVVLVGLTVFLYGMADVLMKIESWEVIWNPPTVGQMAQVLAGALAAVAAALKLDVTALFTKKG